MHGRPPTSLQWKSGADETRPHTTTVVNRFGTWSDAIEQAGFKRPPMAKRLWRDEQIIDAIQVWAQEHGRPPRWEDWKSTGEHHPTSVTVWTRFGSFADAIEQAGFERPKGAHAPQRASRSRNREERIADLHRALEKGVNS